MNELIWVGDTLLPSIVGVVALTVICVFVYMTFVKDELETKRPRSLSKEECQILNWASEGRAVVWPTDASDSLYLAGKRLEQLGFLENVAHSPEQWDITLAGRVCLSQFAKHKM